MTRDVAFDLAALCLGARLARLPHSDTRAAHDGNDSNDGRERTRTMAAHEFREPIRPTVGARLYGCSAKVALDVLRECVHRCVTIRGFLLQGAIQDCVEIATQQLAALGSRGRCACQRRIDLHDRFLECCGGLSFEAIWFDTREQLVAHDTEGVDVTRRADRHPHDLFWRGVIGCQGACRELGLRALIRAFAREQLADPEIEQVHRAIRPTRMFAGLRSRCTTRRACACVTARAT